MIPVTENKVFLTANDAFIYYYTKIMDVGLYRNGTSALYNVSFYIYNPTDRLITAPWRKWKSDYAEREWQWYISGDRSVTEIKKYAKIWDKMHGGDDIVNSNYGWQWMRNDQLERCIELLATNPTTRQAYISIFDGKERSEYDFDTPCTMSIGFFNHYGKLCMNVHMRSNDLVYGFCNDQYCFSKLQEYVATRLNLAIGWYNHKADDLHIYERHFNLKQ